MAGEGLELRDTGVMIAVTMVLAVGSATFFVMLRCRDTGRVFGPRSRWWALAVIGVTSLAATAVGILSTTLLQNVFPAMVGAAGPSGLLLEKIRKPLAEDRRTLGQEVSTLWLVWMLDRLDQSMADDRDAWCEARVDLDWTHEGLLEAARHYHAYLKGRMPAAERRRARLDARLRAVEDRIDVVRIIENGASVTKVLAALRSYKVTKERRYDRYRGDLPYLAQRLRHDAERDLTRLLAAGYGAGFHHMKPFNPPVRGSAVLRPDAIRPYP